MRRGKVCVLLLAGALALASGGCQREEAVSVVTKQPVLGEDEGGYAGFDYLQAYTFGEEAQNSVLYLPADENAYVGATCIISKAEGVEVMLNYAPMLNEQITDKPIDQKLQYMLDTEFSDTYAADYENLDISEIEDLNEDTVGATISYLEYDDAGKAQVASFVQYLYTKLEDGREFKTTIKIDSDEEGAFTAAVADELARYFAVDIPYEEGLLQAKLDNYQPDEATQLKMDSNTVSFDIYDIYFPKEWEESEIFYELLPENFMEENNIEEMVCLMESDITEADSCIFAAKSSAGISSGELIGLGAEKESRFEEYYEESLRALYQEMGMKAEDMNFDVIGNTDLGYIMRIDVKNIELEDGENSNIYSYYIYRGDKFYMLGLTMLAEITADEQQSLYDTLDQIYSTMEVR